MKPNSRVPSVFLLSAVLFVLLAYAQAGQILINSPSTKQVSGATGYGFGVTKVCSDKIAVVGGVRPLSPTTGIVNTFTSTGSSFTTSRPGALTDTATNRRLSLGTNLPLSFGDSRVYTLRQATGGGHTSDVVYKLTANCSSLDPGGSGLTSWKAVSIATSYPSQLQDFSGAIVNKRYFTFAGGESLAFSGNFSAGTGVTTYVNVTDAVVIIDGVDDSVSSTKLSQARSGLAGASIGSSAWYGGGLHRNERQFFDTIDVIKSDLTIDSTSFSLSQARGYLAAASLGDVVVFAGGVSDFVDSGNGTYEAEFSSRVDIFNVKTNEHTQYELSEARGYLAGIVSDDFILFVGGVNSQAFDSSNWAIVEQTESVRVDYYHVASNTWAVGVITRGRYQFSGAALGNSAYVSAGAYFNSTNGVMEPGFIGDVLTFAYYSSASSLAPASIFSIIYSYLFA